MKLKKKLSWFYQALPEKFSLFISERYFVNSLYFFLFDFNSQINKNSLSHLSLSLHNHSLSLSISKEKNFDKEYAEREFLSFFY
jgi:hypothetical protein